MEYLDGQPLEPRHRRAAKARGASDIDAAHRGAYHRGGLQRARPRARPPRLRRHAATDHPPRRQPSQYLRQLRRAGEAGRLRDRQGGRLARRDRGRGAQGDGRVHGAGASRRRSDRLPRRSLRHGDRPLGAARGAPALPRRQRGEHPPQADERAHPRGRRASCGGQLRRSRSSKRSRCARWRRTRTRGSRLRASSGPRWRSGFASTADGPCRRRRGREGAGHVAFLRRTSARQMQGENSRSTWPATWSAAGEAGRSQSLSSIDPMERSGDKIRALVDLGPQATWRGVGTQLPEDPHIGTVPGAESPKRRRSRSARGEQSRPSRRSPSAALLRCGCASSIRRATTAERRVVVPSPPAESRFRAEPLAANPSPPPVPHSLRRSAPHGDGASSCAAPAPAPSSRDARPHHTRSTRGGHRRARRHPRPSRQAVDGPRLTASDSAPGFLTIDTYPWTRVSENGPRAPGRRRSFMRRAPGRRARAVARQPRPSGSISRTPRRSPRAGPRSRGASVCAERGEKRALADSASPWTAARGILGSMGNVGIGRVVRTLLRAPRVLAVAGLRAGNARAPPSRASSKTSSRPSRRW